MKNRCRIGMLCLMFAILSVHLQPALAQTISDAKPFVPKFLRKERSAEILSLDACTPEYPAKSIRNEEEGTAIVTFVIAPTGRALTGKITQSSGFPALDQATLSSLGRCRFKPASIDGKPVKSLVKLAYTWRLD